MKELKQALKDNKVIIGTDRIMRMLRNGKLNAIYLASNCPNNTREDIKHYAKLHNIKINELKENNEELGIICKKTFSISVLGF